MKQTFFAAVGVIGSFIANLLGGWDTALSTLIVLMIIDYVSGMVVAGVFKKSKKTGSGALESGESLKGICKKGMMLLIVLIGYRLDLLHILPAEWGDKFVRTAVIIAFIANELLSIVENAGMMGIKLPKVLIGAIDILQKKSESGLDDESTEHTKEAEGDENRNGSGGDF